MWAGPTKARVVRWPQEHGLCPQGPREEQVAVGGTWGADGDRPGGLPPPTRVTAAWSTALSPPAMWMCVDALTSVGEGWNRNTVMTVASTRLCPLLYAQDPHACPTGLRGTLKHKEMGTPQVAWPVAEDRCSGHLLQTHHPTPRWSNSKRLRRGKCQD